MNCQNEVSGYADNFPLQIGPDQVRVITLNDAAELFDYARPVVNEIHANMVRVDPDFSASTRCSSSVVVTWDRPSIADQPEEPGSRAGGDLHR